jgi:dihydrofolate synthase/folylpolyglutamate synthase
MTMTYEQAIAYIHGTYAFGAKLGLDNIRALLAELGNPQEKLKVVHVAGTNGKGSTSAFIQSILMQAGYRVGLYTSPYLERFTERIRVGSEEIGREELAVLTAEVREAVNRLLQKGHAHPTEFEIVTAIGLLYFQREKVDFLVLEVGLGGRLDATNVIENPLASVITPVAMDHQAYLGNELSAIAGEKAGIIKPGRPVIVGRQEPEALEVIRKVAEAQEAPLRQPDVLHHKILSKGLDGIQFSYENHTYQITLVGLYQVENAILAIETCRALVEDERIALSEEEIRWGLAKAKWPGRFEVLSKDPMVIIDGAHNLAGIMGLTRTFDEILKGKPKRALFGILADKEVDEMVKQVIPYFDSFVLTRPDNPRAMAPEELRQRIWSYKPHAHVVIFDSIEDASEDALVDLASDEVLVAFGSLYMIGAVRTYMNARLSMEV